MGLVSLTVNKSNVRGIWETARRDVAICTECFEHTLLQTRGLDSTGYITVLDNEDLNMKGLYKLHIKRRILRRR